MEEHRCYGCMELTDKEVCPRCGWTQGRDNAAHQLRVGSVLKEQYLVGRVLGQGGFGITYLGWDMVLEAPVAIKEFYPRELVDRDHHESDSVAVYSAEMGAAFAAGRERVVREAKALAKLRDIPQIVGVQNCFHANGTVYIIMEYVRGMELVRFVRQKGRLTVQQTLDILEPVMTALEKVHSQGLVHRDISPDNIMLDMMGNARVLDFGAVRSLDAEDTEAELSHSTEAIVKHGFAPAEQYRSRGVLGPWTDEYALCATIWYCLTGSPPPDALALSMEEETLDRASVPELTDAQWAALTKGMSPRARDRFGDLGLLREALRGGADQPRPPRKKGWIAALVIVLILGAAGVGTWLSGIWKQIPGLEGVLNGTGEQLSAQVTTEPSTAPTTAPTTEPVTAPTAEPTAEPTEELVAPPTTEPATEPTTEPTQPPEPWEANVLAPNPFTLMGLSLEGITIVEFRAETSGAPTDRATDLSRDKDGSVLGWVEYGSVVIAAEGGVNGVDACAGLFQDLIRLQKVTFGGALHTETTTDMSCMFRRCHVLEQVDTENLDTSSVVTMRSMFDMHNMDGDDQVYATAGNYVLKALDMTTWDVSNVQDMSRMFYYCNLLGTVGCADWIPSSVTDMSWMFAYCTELLKVEVDRWDTGSVEDMSYMFYGCDAMKRLDIADWDTSSVINMSHMFDGCTGIRILDLGNWDTGNVEDMSYMFYKCSILEAPDISAWDVSSLRTASCMFLEAITRGDFDLSGWDTHELRDVSHMFDTLYRGITIAGVGNWDRKHLTGYDTRYAGFAPWGLVIDGQDWQLWFKEI